MLLYGVRTTTVSPAYFRRRQLPLAYSDRDKLEPSSFPALARPRELAAPVDACFAETAKSAFRIRRRLRVSRIGVGLTRISHQA